MAAHALLNTFRANKPAFGTWLTTGGFVHARSLARALIGTPQQQSWIMLDCEHGLLPLNPAGATEVIAAIHGVRDGPSALVRIPATGHGVGNGSEGVNWQIKYALDAGARGVLVPMVSTPAQAHEVVLSSRFPPVGRRGFGSPYTQENWDIQTAGEYLNEANESVVVLVQIETREGVQNVQAIAEVDGIDGLFIGPYDLSISLGYPPPSPDPHPQVEQVIQDILTVAHKAGKKCAMFCTSGTQAARRAAEGFDMINVTSDVGAMQSGLAAEFEAAASA
ncbi:Pyruvate/Phosphoenolpyruvate kinase-like domain-containing protein [Lentinula edodes]|uniref:Pyruvate/Phosphoenolpyruvate kinase-like domain-containing protein n=1 Tax=Lentinula edodes TaxID=5353 RepID=UPI001E8D4430|nr:Pyruvate/Phosphoenolpyruvate kinase-like domain-containing protein [Lentinula edodes]KAH7871290.1 Pyruvate/Phosphoenolpyruvate kinase-like domain-containing protein [Lentinula edodes]